MWYTVSPLLFPWYYFTACIRQAVLKLRLQNEENSIQAPILYLTYTVHCRILFVGGGGGGGDGGCYSGRK